MTINISKATATEYAFVLGKIPSESDIHAVDILRLNVNSLTLPGVSLDNTQFNWQGKHVQYHIGNVNFDPLTINFLVDSEFRNWNVLYNWVTFISDNKEKPSMPADAYVTDASLMIYDNFGHIHSVVTFKNVWIQTLGEVTFSVKDGESLIEGTATFLYDRYEVSFGEGTTTTSTTYSMGSYTLPRANTSGTSGSSGTSGNTGSSGTSGIAGSSGTSGVSFFGVTSGTSGVGTSGTSGYSGESGSSGSSGTSGVSFFGVTSGTSGESGETGTSGTSGETGTSGSSGSSGTSGETGTSGSSGSSGTSGEAGSSGTSGEAGSSGTSGSTLVDATELICGTSGGGAWTSGIANITNSTSVTDALFSLDDLITAIAPAPAGLLTSQALTLTNTTKYSAKLPSGLTSDWYKDGAVAGGTITDYVVDNTFTITTPNASTIFRCGTASAPSGVLSLKRDTSVVDTYDIANGTGSSTMITVTSVATYNSIWSKANAYANITQDDEGHRSYTLSHPVAGETTATTIRYDDLNIAPLFSVNPTVTEQTLVAKYLSGITYYGQNSILRVSYTAAVGIFIKGYHPTNVSQITMIPTAMPTNNQNPGSTPAYNDTFAVSNLDLTLSVSNRASNTPSLTFALFKPNGYTSSTSVSLDRNVCTYGTVSTTTADTFFDEAQRLVLDINTAWTSSTALSNGNAQVRNGVLQYPNSTEYVGFSGDQEYQRWLYKTSASTGTLTLTGISYTDVDPYGTGDLNVLIQLDTDGIFFDLGRAVGSNNGSGSGTSRENSKGGRSSGSGSIINWSLGTYTTADNTNRYRIIIIFRNTTHSITAISST